MTISRLGELIGLLIFYSAIILSIIILTPLTNAIKIRELGISDNLRLIAWLFLVLSVATLISGLGFIIWRFYRRRHQSTMLKKPTVFSILYLLLVIILGTLAIIADFLYALFLNIGVGFADASASYEPLTLFLTLYLPPIAHAIAIFFFLRYYWRLLKKETN